MGDSGSAVSVTVSNVTEVVFSSEAVLTVLADTDHDGLPDIWENEHGLMATDPSDGARDDDGDGMSNAAEYFAGTDPFDAASSLKLGITTTNGAVLQFTAVSNRTYTVLYADQLPPGQWTKLADVLASGVTRIETVTDLNSRTNRLYRVVTPIQP